MYIIYIMYIQKSITIPEEQEEFIQDKKLNLSKITQEALKTEMLVHDWKSKKLTGETNVEKHNNKHKHKRTNKK